jgi:hypothetical protein
LRNLSEHESTARVSASVTRFTVGELGTRTPVGWYVGGVEQREHWDRQLYPTDGSSLRS